jgi:regulator of sirC expression with transglutaminase-like and TPR domain
MTEARQEAILKLIGDEDSATVALMLAELRRDHMLVVGLLPFAQGRAREQLEVLLWEIEWPERVERLEEVLPDLHTLQGLEKFSWSLAAAGQPCDQVAAAEAKLDEWGRTLRDRLASARGGNDTAVLQLQKLLGSEAGLRGDDVDYESAENSFLDCVILRKRGLPITLSLIYMLVGARAGLAVDGVAAPGHFLAKIGESYFDPFNGGEPVPKEALSLLLALEKNQDRRYLLEAAPIRSIARRMLNNLTNMDKNPRRLALWEKLLEQL